LLPPVFDPADDAVAIPDYFCAGRAGSFRGRNIGVVDAIFDVIDSGFEKCFADAKNVVAHEPDRAIAIIDDALTQT